MNKQLHKGIIRFCLLCLAGLLVACDGGLFGTGDGSADDNLIITGGGSSDGITDSMETSPGIDTGTSPATDTTAGPDEGDISNVDPSGTATDTNASSPNTPQSGATRAFENTDQAVNTVAVPFGQVLNLSTRRILLASNAPDELLIDQPGLADNAISQHLALMEGTSSLYFLDATPEQPPTLDHTLFAIDPMTLDPSTVTTFIVREHNSIIDVLPLRTQTSTVDQNLALVRLVQASALNDANKISSLKLNSTGPNPGGVDITFDNISYDGVVDDAYQSVPAGDYLLEDPTSGFSAQAISLEGGKVYTLIWLSLTEPVLQIHVDGGNQQ